MQTFECEITIRKGDDHFSAGSILEVLSANLDMGARVILEAIGPDAAKALDRLEELLREFKRQEEGGFI